MTSNTPEIEARVLAHLDGHLGLRPHLAERIFRELLISLHRKNIASIDEIQDEARARLGQVQRTPGDPNQAERDRWDERERETVEAVTRELVGRHLPVAAVDDAVNLTLKREQAHRLENIANSANVSFRELSESVQQFCALPLGETLLAPAEVVGTRVALTRHLISDQLELLGIAKNHLRIRDFEDITRRIIGTDDGMGRIGGKAGGMLLAYSILREAESESNDFLRVAIPESYYLRSDVVEDFLRLNRLEEYRSQKYKPIDDVQREYPLIRGVFRNGDFPLKIVHQLRRILDRLGTHPLIVRSSSLLEDRVGTGFCGKYASIFLPNQGPLERRLRALLGAVAEVYASMLAPDPILYRREHNLIDYVEQMAILIQKVVGVPFGDYFLPTFAGVAFSRNEFRWSPRIRREDGMARLVIGLGTRAVDRSGSDYARILALAEPTLRPESTVDEIRRCSQRFVDTLDVASNKMRTLRFTELVRDDRDFPMLDRMVSRYEEGGLYEPTGLRVDANPDDLCITFEKLLRATPFANRLRDMLCRLEDAYNAPVDLEFASDGERLYILQCRTQSLAAESGPVTLPTNLPEKDIIFDAHRFVRTGSVRNIEYIVYIDPADYDAAASHDRRVAIAHAVGRINRALAEKAFILIGPGRWGTRDVRLGVPVGYADINHCKVLIEVARASGGFAPEVSFGTHFFQDLIEADILYLPLYPDDPGTRFNHAFLSQEANVVAELLPADAEFANVIRVIDVPRATQGRRLAIDMDGESDRAIAYLSK